MMRFLRIFILIISILAAGGAFAQTLTLEDYLKQVREKHGGFRASEQAILGAQLYTREASLLLSPTLFGSAQTASDMKPNLSVPATMRAERTNENRYQLGLSQLTTFGLQGKFFYTYVDRSFVNSFLMNQYEASPTLELSQALGRNGLGAETRAMVELSEANARAKGYQESYKMKVILYEAESNYWRLALAREAVLVSKEAVSRAEKIFDWSSKRAKLGLADRADYIQSEASVKARRLDLKTALDEERSAALAFNSTRGLQSEDMKEKLTDLTPEMSHNLEMPARHQNRDDLKAAEELTKVARASAEIGREKNKPTFEVYGAMTYNSVTHNSSDSLANSYKAYTPTTAVGLRFTAPLDFGLASDIRQGYEKEKIAADLAIERKRFEQERDWNDLTRRFVAAKDRLRLFEELEETQKTKLLYEKDRHTRGRTTIAQVLLFELDFEQAQLGRIRTLAELLQIFAQMKLYGVSYESR